MNSRIQYIDEQQRLMNIKITKLENLTQENNRFLANNDFVKMEKEINSIKYYIVYTYKALDSNLKKVESKTTRLDNEVTSITNLISNYLTASEVYLSYNNNQLRSEFPLLKSSNSYSGNSDRFNSYKVTKNANKL